MGKAKELIVIETYGFPAHVCTHLTRCSAPRRQLVDIFHCICLKSHLENPQHLCMQHPRVCMHYPQTNILQMKTAEICFLFLMFTAVYTLQDPSELADFAIQFSEHLALDNIMIIKDNSGKAWPFSC